MDTQIKEARLQRRTLLAGTVLFALLQPLTKAANAVGLSTKLQDLTLAQNGLVANIIAFNIGVELGQFAALALILVAFQLWRRSGTFTHGAYAANVAIMAAGFTLFGYQLTGYLLS